MANQLTPKQALVYRLGSDLTAPINGIFTSISGVDLVIQDIQLLLLTMAGERVFRPTYGCGLKSMIWENIGVVENGGAAEIKNALDLYESRITVVNVTSQTNENTGLVIFNIQFIINATDQNISLIFPLRVSTDISFA